MIDRTTPAAQAARLLLGFGLIAFVAPVRAADAPAPQPAAGVAAPAAEAEPELTPEEKAEREGRKACKVAICSAFHVRKPGDDISCAVLKTWRKTQINKMISRAKVSWPYGNVRCTADIRLKRADLIKAMTEDRYETVLDKHAVTCTVEREGGAAPSEIKFDFAPKITFEKGKAVKAQLNWGKIEGPTIVKGALWTATATDNTFNVLQTTMVDDINDFVDKKCLEVKDAWSQ